MYLHLGRDVEVPFSEIVGIFDLDTVSVSKRTRSFLSSAEKKKQVVNVSDDIPKSCVICSAGGKTRVYISQISSATLKKRAEGNVILGNLL